jgi:hypothetical protein
MQGGNFNLAIKTPPQTFCLSIQAVNIIISVI